MSASLRSSTTTGKGAGSNADTSNSISFQTSALPSFRGSSAANRIGKDDKTKMVGTFSLSVRRWLLQFRMLPRNFQRLILFIVAVTAVISGGYLSSMTHQQPKEFNYENKKSRLAYAPRIIRVGLMFENGNEESQGDAILWARSSSIGKLPKRGEREIVSRYDPIRQNAPKLKAASSMNKGECHAMHDWQGSQNPSCNVIHESSFGFEHPLGWNFDGDSATADFDYHQVSRERGLFEDLDEQVRLIAGGAFRWVWMIREYDGTRRALKTLRIDEKNKNFDLRNFDRHRRDAVAMDQLTGSSLIVNMYGYCSNSALFDYGEGGDLTGIFDREPNISEEKILRIAYNVSLSIHDAHHFDDQGRATIAHTDIKPDQFLYQDGYYRLTDFNRVRFLLWNSDKNSKCGFTVGKNGGVWRSPEEYAYRKECEKVDVFSLGNVLFYLLTRQEPWMRYSSNKVYSLVKNGSQPPIPNTILESDSIFAKYMMAAMKLAFTLNQHERPGALEVAEKLKEGIEQYEALSAKQRISQ